jgi:tyrosine-protein kinase Etk/Wzc
MQGQNWNNLDKDDAQEFNIRQQLERYLINWKWFLLSAFIFLTFAFLHLRYTTPQYSIAAKVLIKDDKKGGLASEMGSFGDMASLSGVKSNVDNELEVLKSRTLIQKTVKDLNLNISYFSDGRIKSSQLYTSSPITVEFFDKSPTFNERDTTFIIKPVTGNSFDIKDTEGNNGGTFQFGATIVLPFAKMVVIRKPSEGNVRSEPAVMVQLYKLENVTNQYVGKLNVDAINKSSSILTLSMVEPVKALGQDFINRLIFNYNKDAVEDKNQVARNTEIFINQRLLSITKELDTVEGDIELFKKENKVTDIVSEAQVFLSSATEYERDYMQIQTKLNIVNDVIALLDTTTNDDLIPSNLISDEGNTSGLIEQYNLLVLTKKRILKDATPNNPTVINLEEQLSGMRQSVKKSLKNIANTFLINERDLKRQANILGGKIG